MVKTEKNTRSLVDIVQETAASEKLNLPVFPGAAFELQQLLADDNTSIDQIAKVVAKDQAMATQVLKLANSAFFSGWNTVRTIREAILRLGLNHVFNLVVCTSQQKYYKSANQTLQKMLEVLWKHALCCAIGSKWLVQKLGYREFGDEAFLSGLLHDLGKLVLIKAIETMQSEYEDLDLPAELIAQIFDSMHAEQGYYLMEEWSIPDIYCKVALNHHNEEFDKSDILLMAVRVVNHVCSKAGISTHPQEQIDLQTLPEVQALSVKQAILVELELVIKEAIEVEYHA
jgi:HD-like signal output (HDOD) protein